MSQTKALLSTYFIEQHGAEPQMVVQSPGRVNIIGEHTDYNEGFVLPAAIDKVVTTAISLRNDDQLHFFAQDLNETYTGSINQLHQSDLQWANYIIGSLAQFAKFTTLKNGFNIAITSTVPIGSGLSSSAALESAVIYAVNELLQTNVEKNELIRMAQKVEHEFAGVNCGIMDMFASVMGKKGHAIKLDCADLSYEYIPVDISGYKLVLFNTNVKHNLASSEYNTRRKECEQGVAWINEHHSEVTSLRKATVAQLDEYVLPKNQTVYNRCRYVVDEINRLQTACDDLKTGNITSLGKKMFDTHDGLSKLYEVSCKELDYLVDAVRDNVMVLGARMMGGGFGGCTINIVKEEAIEKLVQTITPAYQKATGLELSVYIASIENGTEII